MIHCWVLAVPVALSRRFQQGLLWSESFCPQSKKSFLREGLLVWLSAIQATEELGPVQLLLRVEGQHWMFGGLSLRSLVAGFLA